jgi:hypothetical protein
MVEEEGGSSLAGAGWRGRAAPNVVVDDAGSSRSGDIVDNDKLEEVVTGSSSSGRPALALSPSLPSARGTVMPLTRPRRRQ